MARSAAWTVFGAIALAAACGDNRASPPDSSAVTTIDYIELPMLPDYNHASETVVASSGNNVVVLAIDQKFPFVDSFEYPPTDDDPLHPFRRIAFATSHDRGRTFSAPASLFVDGHSDPLIATAANGAFWVVGVNTGILPTTTDVMRSSDGGDTFQPIATTPIADKPWLAVDEARQAVWIAGYGWFGLVGFEQSIRASVAMGFGMTTAYADHAGIHAIEDEDFQTYVWDGTGDPRPEGDPLPAGDASTSFTTASSSMGLRADGSVWIVRALQDSIAGSPIVVRVRTTDDAGTDVPISPPGTVGFLPVAALDRRGLLHAVWYDSSGGNGRLVYVHSVSTNLLGDYTAPIVVDDNACPGRGWYPYYSADPPPGGRRLREYIGLTITGDRAIISWTHAPDPPSRVRIAHIDF